MADSKGKTEPAAVSVGANTVLENVTFANNVKTTKSGISALKGTYPVTAVNCAFYHNYSMDGTKASETPFYAADGKSVFSNCAFTGTRPDTVSTDSPDCIYSADFNLVDPDSGDYRPAKSRSPLVDAGGFNTVPAAASSAPPTVKNEGRGSSAAPFVLPCIYAIIRAMQKPIATNTSDFEAIRKAGQTYVDKTAYFHRLITDPNRSFYFIARPRRFGKSLCVTTLKSIFQGHREFFKGLAIDKTDYDWKKHAVIHFNWGMVDPSSIENFDRTFAPSVKDALVDAGYAYEDDAAPSLNLKRAIEYFYAKDGVGPAILIDEYDDPVAKSLKDIPRANLIRDRLASIYAQFKDNSGKIRFLFITGVSKFTKLSIFSTLSSLNDITFEDEYAAMFGYTEEELGANFEEHLRAHAEKMNLSYEDYRAELRRWYNGYRFARKAPVAVYNPVSIALTLVTKDDEFRGNWSQTGRASSLMNVISREGILALDYEGLTGVDESEFDVSDLRSIGVVGLLYQTGYLTIKDYADGIYMLGVPDEEVRRDLSTLLAGVAANQDMKWAANLGVALRLRKWDQFFTGLKALYAGMAYGSLEERAHESSYARCLSFLLAAHGFRFHMEDVQADGRADVVAEHPCGVFIFELKVDEPASAALEQVRAKGYDAPYRAKGQPIHFVGLGFDSKTRHLADAAAVSAS